MVGTDSHTHEKRLHDFKVCFRLRSSICTLDDFKSFSCCKYRGHFFVAYTYIKSLSFSYFQPLCSVWFLTMFAPRICPVRHTTWVAVGKFLKYKLIIIIDTKEKMMWHKNFWTRKLLKTVANNLRLNPQKGPCWFSVLIFTQWLSP